MTLGEFRSRHHHAGYDGFDSERGFLVELPAGERAEVPSQPPPKVWIDADTFARTYHRPLALDALNVLRERNGLSPIAPQASVDSSGRETRAYRGGIPRIHEPASETLGLPPGTIPIRTAAEHDVMYRLDGDIVRVDFPRGFQTAPQAWSETAGQAMAGSPTPEEAPPAYMGGCCTQGPSMAG